MQIGCNGFGETLGLGVAHIVAVLNKSEAVRRG